MRIDYKMFTYGTKSPMIAWDQRSVAQASSTRGPSAEARLGVAEALQEQPPRLPWLYDRASDA